MVRSISCGLSPRPTESEPCGSKSTSSTLRPYSASAAPRLMVVVVLPTPPFWLHIETTRALPWRRERRGLRELGHRSPGRADHGSADRGERRLGLRLRVGDERDRVGSRGCQLQSGRLRGADGRSNGGISDGTAALTGKSSRTTRHRSSVYPSLVAPDMSTRRLDAQSIDRVAPILRDPMPGLRQPTRRRRQPPTPHRKSVNPARLRAQPPPACGEFVDSPVYDAGCVKAAVTTAVKPAGSTLPP